MDKTIEDFIETDPKTLEFKERALKFEEEIKPISEKWGVAPWAGLQSSNEIIAAVPQLKDLFEKSEPENGLPAA
jgi:hypothetical protein